MFSAVQFYRKMRGDRKCTVALSSLVSSVDISRKDIVVHSFQRSPDLAYLTKTRDMRSGLTSSIYLFSYNSFFLFWSIQLRDYGKVPPFFIFGARLLMEGRDFGTVSVVSYIDTSSPLSVITAGHESDLVTSRTLCSSSNLERIFKEDRLKD